MVLRRSLTAASENYLKYCISTVAVLLYLFQLQEYLKNFARSKLFYPPYAKGFAGYYRFTSLVHARAPLVCLFLILKYGTLEVLTQNYLRYWICAVVTHLSLQKQQYFENLVRSKLFDPPYLWKDIDGSSLIELHCKFKNCQIRHRIWFRQELFSPLFS